MAGDQHGPASREFDGDHRSSTELKGVETRRARDGPAIPSAVRKPRAPSLGYKFVTRIHGQNLGERSPENHDPARKRWRCWTVAIHDSLLTHPGAPSENTETSCYSTKKNKVHYISSIVIMLLRGAICLILIQATNTEWWYYKSTGNDDMNQPIPTNQATNHNHY